MKLRSVTIEGYRSINEKISIICEPRVTVILAANDHGKTNFLEAIRHLNTDHPFNQELDLNWDRDASENLPYIRFDLTLDRNEQEEIQKILDIKAKKHFAESVYKRAQATFDESVTMIQNLEVELRVVTEDIKKLSIFINDKPSSIDADKRDQYDEVKQAKNKISDLEKQRADLENRLSKLTDSKTDKYNELLGAAAHHVEASNVSNSGKQNTDALTSNLLYLIKKPDVLAKESQKLAEALNSGRQQLSQHQAANDANNIQKTQLLIQDIEKQSTIAAEALKFAQQDAVLWKDVLDFIKTDVYQKISKPRLPKEARIAAPTSIAAERVGIGGNLVLVLPNEVKDEDVENFIVSHIPRVELIGPVSKVLDSATREDMDKPDFAFMRGVFYYATLKRDEWDRIFIQDDESTNRLDQASAALNETLRHSWSQGKNLQFLLRHFSRENKIELSIKDPGVAKRVVRVSRRSTGFTHFFTLKTILHSRQTESPANSYIWLFDEPGLYLHPDGQHDLIKVIETLSLSNQVLYSTHSLFMINKNYPTRHRLLYKTGTEGTKADSKPHHGHWKPTIEALGLALPGTILFASNILLVEGDSDPILLNSVLLKLIEMNEVSFDLNSLSIIPTNDSKNADAIVRILTESSIKPKIAALFDGDAGGIEKSKKIADLLRQHGIESKVLSKDSTIEDHLLGVNDIFVRAVATYISKITKGDLSDILPKVASSYKAKDKAGVAAWSREVGTGVANLVGEPSPVGIAREYSLLLSDTSGSVFQKGADLKRSVALVNWIAEALDLPKQTLKEEKIVA